MDETEWKETVILSDYQEGKTKNEGTQNVGNNPSNCRKTVRSTTLSTVCDGCLQESVDVTILWFAILLSDQFG